MNKIKLFSTVLLFSLLFSISFMAFATSGDGCDGCKRTSVLKGVTGSLDLNSFRSRLAERVTNPCFQLKYYARGNPPEYYFTANYEAEMNGQIKSRLDINLYFEDGELIHNWKTESDRPTVTFHWHLRNMFINPSALFRKWVPLDITLLNDFEKRPEKCEIKPEKEELFPGQEIKVKLSNIVDFEGRKSREFNRIVVQAVKGEIIGGTPLLVDPELKAFQVGDGTITFTYRAPDGEKSRITEDKIIVYNSCDILRKDEYHMSKTGLKHKIAEKKIKLIRADAELTLTEISKIHSDIHDPMAGDDRSDSEIQITIKATFEYDNTYTYPLVDEGEYKEYYNLTSWQILTANGNSKEHYRYFSGPDNHGCTAEKLVNSEAKAANFSKGEKEDKEDALMCITFNAKTGKAKEVEAFTFSGNFNWLGHSKEQITIKDPKKGSLTENKDRDINSKDYFEINLSPSPVKSGDGIHKMGGSETTTVPSHWPYDDTGYDQFLTKWEVVRHRK